VGALAAAACLLLSVTIVPGVPLEAQSPAAFEVMDWNIQHGLDMSNASNLQRVATWIANINPHVVSLNEVEKLNGYNNNADEPAVLESDLESRTGVQWYRCFAQRTGAERGQGNLILSRVRIESCQAQLLTGMRSVARATLTVNNSAIAVFSTHLDDASASTRTAQIAQLLTFANSTSGDRILMGDFNAIPSAAELAPLRTGWDDAWVVATAARTAVSYAGNTAGVTRNGRIDYIWRSKTAARLVLQSAQVYDTGSISDHRPVSATYSVTTTTQTVMPAPGNLRVIR
jgi:endonuclease/exonuclease/phosphatase family metal-dependent hydrolase